MPKKKCNRRDSNPRSQRESEYKSDALDHSATTAVDFKVKKLKKSCENAFFEAASVVDSLIRNYQL